MDDFLSASEILLLPSNCYYAMIEMYSNNTVSTLEYGSYLQQQDEEEEGHEDEEHNNQAILPVVRNGEQEL